MTRLVGGGEGEGGSYLFDQVSLVLRGDVEDVDEVVLWANSSQSLEDDLHDVVDGGEALAFKAEGAA